MHELPAEEAAQVSCSRCVVGTAVVSPRQPSCHPGGRLLSFDWSLRSAARTSRMNCTAAHV
eukprot:6201514-Pleurochrysis_carterae.AAC.6